MSYYTAIDILTLLTLVVMCILVYENNRLGRDEKKQFYLTYALIAAAALAEWFGTILDGVAGLPTWVLMLAKCLDYSLTPMAGGAIVRQMGIKTRLTKALDTVLAANIVFQVAALFGGWMVTIDEHNHYHHGDLYIVYIVMYLIVLVLVLLHFNVYGKRFRRQNRTSLYSIMLLVVVGVYLQETASGEVRTVYLTMALAAALLFIHNAEFSQLKQDESLEEKDVQIMTDELTGLLSRHAYSEVLSGYETAGELPSGLAAFVIDINGLKSVNDRYGHSAGDELICGAARCIEEAFSGMGQCFRTGGDEFAVIATGMSREQAEKIREDLARTSGAWRGHVAEGLHLAVGYALAEDHPALSMEKLIVQADNAMYEAKKAYYQQAAHDRRGRR